MLLHGTIGFLIVNLGERLRFSLRTKDGFFIIDSPLASIASGDEVYAAIESINAAYLVASEVV